MNSMKYEVGDDVYLADDGRIRKATVWEVDTSRNEPLPYRLEYMADGDSEMVYFAEEDIHPTIEELLSYLKTDYQKRQ